MVLHKAAHGTTFIIPKFHLRGHVPDQIEADNGVIDMFIIERHHLRVRAVADPIDNTRVFETSVMSSLLTAQCNELASDFRHGSVLLGAVKGFPVFPGAQVATRMQCNGLEYAANDMVLLEGSPACIVACATQDG